MIAVYNLGIRLYSLLIFLASPFSSKAKLWISGRRTWRKKAIELKESLPQFHGHWVWVHCSSLGEFEQGRPLIEAIKKYNPQTPILLTFYSPSGYEIRKDYPHADHIQYLPIDTPANARDFLEYFHPALAVMVKYDLWYHYLKELDRKEIPTILISGLFRTNHIYFKPYGGLFRKMLTCIDYFFLQNESSAALLRQIGINSLEVTGDNRVDRVAQLAKSRKALPAIKAFAEEKKVFIGGSTWPSDLKIISPFLNEFLPVDWKMIIAPHEIGESSIAATEKSLHPLRCQRYSQWVDHPDHQARCLLIDNIGMLSSIYAYGRLAYIGGGQQKSGIHNTLEPAVFGLPILFGPRFTHFEEAVSLVKRKAAFPLDSTESLLKTFSYLQVEKNWETASHGASQFIQENEGATKKVMTVLEQKAWLPLGELLSDHSD